MSLDGLRAWIGEVERKLGMRTRVFLVLAVIAIGAAGAAIYLAVDAHDSAVSESDVQALQEQLEAQIGAGGGSTAAAQLEVELSALRTQVERLSDEGGSAKGKGSPEGNSGSGEGGPKGGESSDSGSAEGTSGGATGGGATAAKLQELLERAKEESEASE